MDNKIKINNGKMFKMIRIRKNIYIYKEKN